MSERTPFLDVRDVYAGYGGTLILHGVSLTAAAGEIVTVIGPNGSGKSTLMKSIFGLVKPASGSVMCEGDDVTGWAPESLVRRGVGYVPQVDNVFGGLSINENLEMGAYTVSGGCADRLAEVYELFPVLAGRKRERAGNLSGGQRQLLALGRALMVRPRLLLLDEPTAGLAPAAVQAVLTHITEINRSGVTMVLVEQNAIAALKMSDRAYVLARGENQLEGKGQALLDDPEVGHLYLGRRRDGAA